MKNLRKKCLINRHNQSCDEWCKEFKVCDVKRVRRELIIKREKIVEQQKIYPIGTLHYEHFEGYLNGVGDALEMLAPNANEPCEAFAKICVLGSCGRRRKRKKKAERGRKMKRLTQANYEYCDCDFMDSGVYEDMNKLSAYEDTNLEPSEVVALKVECEELKAEVETVRNSVDYRERNITDMAVSYAKRTEQECKAKGERIAELEAELKSLEELHKATLETYQDMKAYLANEALKVNGRIEILKRAFELACEHYKATLRERAQLHTCGVEKAIAGFIKQAEAEIKLLDKAKQESACNDAGWACYDHNCEKCDVRKQLLEENNGKL